MGKKALIIGHTGQDGYYLTELLISKEYKVLGISSRSIYSNSGIDIKPGNISDPNFAIYVINEFKPDELYYLAALHQSSVEQNFNNLEFYKKSIDVNAYGLLNFLDAIDHAKLSCKVFYAASSHIFGNTTFEIQNELTPFCPVSIYGVTKVLGMQFCDLYRQKGIFCTVGIFYNHESPRRETKFVSTKIVEAAVAIKLGKRDYLELGDLSAKIDWGYAPDYVYAAYLMMQNKTGENYVVSSGTLHTVEDFVREVFKCLDLEWEKYVIENRNIILKKSMTVLRGDSSKLRQDTQWDNSVSFNEMIKILVQHQMAQK